MQRLGFKEFKGFYSDLNLTDNNVSKYLLN